MDILKFIVQVLEFQNLTNKEVTIAMGNFSVSDVDHVIVNKEIQLKLNKLYLK